MLLDSKILYFVQRLTIKPDTTLERAYCGLPGLFSSLSMLMVNSKVMGLDKRLDQFHCPKGD